MICPECLNAIPAAHKFCAYCGARQMTDAEAHLREVSSQHVRDYLGLPDDDELSLASAGWIPMLIHLHSSVPSQSRSMTEEPTAASCST